MSIGPISHTPGIECWCRQCQLTIFLAARLVNVYGESRNLDYIRAAERITGFEVECLDHDPNSGPGSDLCMNCGRE